MPGKNTNLRPVVGAEVRVTNMVAAKKAAITGGITAGLEKRWNKGVTTSAFATAGYGNASVDLKVDKLFTENLGMTCSLNAGYVQNNRTEAVSISPEVKDLVNQIERDVQNIANEKGQEIIDRTYSFDEFQTNNLNDILERDWAINVNEKNRQFNFMGKVGALFTNNKKNLALEAGVTGGYILSGSLKEGNAKEKEFKADYKLNNGDDNISVNSKANISISTTGRVLGALNVSPYVAVKYNPVGNINLKLESSTLATSFGINYMF